MVAFILQGDQSISAPTLISYNWKVNTHTVITTCITGAPSLPVVAAAAAVNC